MKFKMAKLNYILFLALIFSLIVSACDQISPPYVESSGPVIIDTTKKKVLIEKFTGHRCGNCPPASEEAKRLKEKYQGQVIIMSIHYGSLALPAGEHTYDFTNNTGNDLGDYYSIFATPTGVVNRGEYDGNIILNHPRWEAYAIDEMSESGGVKIDISGEYNEDTKTIDFDVDLQYLTAGSSSHNLILYVVEDSVVQYQLYYGHSPQDVEDYVHDDVLRDAIIGTWGEPISNSNISTGDIFTKSYSYRIPNSEWRAEKLRIIAAVCDSDNSFRVVNVEEYKNKL